MIQTTMCCLMRDLLIQPSTETDLKALRFPCFLQLPSCEAGQKLSSMLCSMSAGGWYLSRFTPDKLTYWNRYCSSLPNCCFVLLPANSRQSNMASWSSIGKFMNIQKFMAPHGSNKRMRERMYTWSRSNKVCCEDAGFIEIRERSNMIKCSAAHPEGFRREYSYTWCLIGIWKEPNIWFATQRPLTKASQRSSQRPKVSKQKSNCPCRIKHCFATRGLLKNCICMDITYIITTYLLIYGTF